MRSQGTLSPPVAAVASAIARDGTGQFSIPPDKIPELGRELIAADDPKAVATELAALSRRFERDVGQRAQRLVQQIALLLLLISPTLNREAGPPN
ncbi:MAG: hypothetical protein HY791_13675 [Deltaproteobacteria bacterium]|nr:hypothetical protein [Deltaproteobacteria bacterium]